MDSGKGMELKSDALQVIHFTTAKQQDTLSTIVSCFFQCGCGHEHNIGANFDSGTEEEGDFRKDCMQLGAVKEADVSCHTSTDNELAMCSVPPVWWLWGWWEQWRRGSRGKFKPEQCLALLKCTWLMKLVIIFFTCTALTNTTYRTF